MSENYSISEENYLKAIFHLQTEDGSVSTNALAEKLQTKPASVTDMMKKLSSKNLLHYKPYYGFTLTSDGKRIALGIIRRHRLWEYFLYEKLHFGWEEVHQIAEELEHVSSKKLIDKLDEFLGFPKFDPHGDPIPDNKGKVDTIEQININELPLSKKAIVVNVSNQTKPLLDELAIMNIAIGTTLEVKKKSEYDGSLIVLIKNKRKLLTTQITKNLFVKLL